MSLSKKIAVQPIYLINFEDYLRPKRPYKITPLQCFDKPKNPATKCSKLKTKTIQRFKIQRNKLSKKCKHLPLPSFLNFLRARNDDCVCKPKTGFEIYCEISSIHGFHNFIGAKTWQRVLWLLLICAAILLSILVLFTSYGKSAKTPTRSYIESMAQPLSVVPIPLPAVTICGLNRISKSQLLVKANEWNVPEHMLQQLPFLIRKTSLETNQTMIKKLSNRNLNWSHLLEQLSPQICENQVVSCKWLGNNQNCQQIMTTIWSYSEGRCCTFTHQQNGQWLSLRLASRQQDYGSSLITATGLMVLLHETHSFIHAATQRVFVPSGTEVHVMLQRYSTRATDYMYKLEPNKRGCYLNNERHLFYFPVYSQDNCLAECLSESVQQNCDCVHPHMPKKWNWSVCKLEQFKCLQQQVNSWDQMQSNCNCLPPCEFYRYKVNSDVATLDISQTSSTSNDYFYNNINASDEILLHIYFDSLSAEQLRVDVFDTWLTLIGTFGGTTGLFMGCSFVSVFELIFFVCVRPICNWLTRQQIRYRLRRRRQAEAAKDN